MAGPWLYCIAAAAGRTFDLGGRSLPLPVNATTYEQLVGTGKITKDPWWYLTRNWKNVQIGDEVFIYTGDRDIGIVGFATVEKLAIQDGDWRIRLHFDLPKCRALLRNPIPAQVVREWIPFPRGNVLSLGPFVTELYSRVPWTVAPPTTAPVAGYAEASDIEGMKTEATRLVTKRSRKLRDAAFKAAAGVCSVCGTDFSKVLNGDGKRVLQVHHREQLSARRLPSVTRMRDLAVVCANCHLLLHLDPNKAMRVDKLREMLNADGHYPRA